MSVTAACVAAGIGRTAAYAWKDDDDEFSAEWDSCFESGTDILEDELRRRALAGSDACLIFALKGRRPHRWRPPPQKAVAVVDPQMLADHQRAEELRGMSDDEIRAELADLEEKRRLVDETRALVPPHNRNGAASAE